MPVLLPTLAGKVNRETDEALTRLRDGFGAVDATVRQVAVGLASVPAPLTLADYRAALSASGSASLNLTGLVGAPVTTGGTTPGGTPVVPTPPVTPPVPPSSGSDIPPPLTAFPTLPAGNRGWKGDFAGMQVGALGQYGKFFTAFYSQYSSSDRAAFRAAYAARQYKQVPISIASGTYHGFYPAFDYGSNPAGFKVFLDELLGDGLVPVVFLTPDDGVLPGLNTGLDWTAAKAIIDPWFSPFYSYAATWSEVGVACVGWEVNDYLSSDAITGLCQYCRTLLGSSPLLYVHFTPGHNAGADPGNAWWTSMRNVLTGILYQEGSRNGDLLRDGCSELTVRFQNGIHGWPTDSGFGHPFDTIAFEYDAYWEVNQGASEAEGIRMGSTGMYANPPAQGYGNGGPNL